MIVYSCVSMHRTQAAPQHSQMSNVLNVSEIISWNYCEFGVIFNILLINIM